LNNNDNKKGFEWTYAPAKESVEHIKLNETYGHFINGDFTSFDKKNSFTSINPATQEKLARISVAGKKEVNAAVRSALNGYQKYWSKISPKERGKYLFRIARMIQERARELSVIETLDGGKPIRESRDFDIPLAAHHFFYYAGWADKLEYILPNRKPKSLGVAAQIIPWNFPLLMAAWKIAPALATGNTVVLKPAETTSLSALKLAEIIRDADLPPGVVNIITGGGATGEQLCAHDDVNKIAFTGSTEIGKDIQKQIDGTSKKLSLELGGKAAHIIFDDAAINQAIEGIVNGIFFNQGHVCCAGSRLLVQENVLDEVIEKLQKRMQSLIVGDPLDKNTDIGAVNNESQLSKINFFLELAHKEGLEVFQTQNKNSSAGYFCAPTLISGVSQNSRLVQEEIFGPVLTVQSFRTTEEAIDKANNTPFGLSAGVWSEKTSRIFQVTSKLRAGVVWANTYNKFDPSSPFGGYKESGFGREGGVHGLISYLSI